VAGQFGGQPVQFGFGVGEAEIGYGRLGHATTGLAPGRAVAESVWPRDSTLI
jgi:hypothetical protein